MVYDACTDLVLPPPPRPPHRQIIACVTEPFSPSSLTPSLRRHRPAISPPDRDGRRTALCANFCDVVAALRTKAKGTAREREREREGTSQRAFNCLRPTMTWMRGCVRGAVGIPQPKWKSILDRRRAARFLIRLRNGDASLRHRTGARLLLSFRHSQLANFLPLTD